MAETSKGQRRDHPFKEKRRFDSTAFPASTEQQSVTRPLEEDGDTDEEEPELDSNDQLSDR